MNTQENGQVEMNASDGPLKSSDVKLGVSQMDFLISSNLRIDPERHLVLGDYPFLRHLRKVVGRPGFFCYWHRETGNFVLCEWIDQRVGVCVEVEVFEGSPQSMWPEDLMPPVTLALRCEYALNSHKKRLKAARYREEAERRARIDENEEKARYVKMLRKKGRDQEAYLIERGVIPFAGEARSGSHQAFAESLFC